MIDQVASERLKAWREEAGLSQVAAGARVGVSGPTWYDWEAGNKTPRTVHQIALEKVTGIERDAWLSAEDKAKIESATATPPDAETADATGAA